MNAIIFIFVSIIWTFLLEILEGILEREKREEKVDMKKLLSYKYFWTNQIRCWKEKGIRLFVLITFTFLWGYPLYVAIETIYWGLKKLYQWL